LLRDLEGEYRDLAEESPDWSSERARWLTRAAAIRDLAVRAEKRWGTPLVWWTTSDSVDVGEPNSPERKAFVGATMEAAVARLAAQPRVGARVEFTARGEVEEIGEDEHEGEILVSFDPETPGIWLPPSDVRPMGDEPEDRMRRDLAYASAWQAVWAVVEERGGKTAVGEPGLAEIAMRRVLAHLTGSPTAAQIIGDPSA
jgi:hypothetical protein